MRWLATSARALVAVELGLLLVAPAWAGPRRPAAVGANDAAALPAADLEPVGPARVEYRVGDRIVLHWTGGVSVQGMKAAFDAAAPSAGTLLEQGWVFASPEPTDPPDTVAVSPVRPGEVTLPSLLLQDTAGKALARTNPWKAQVVSAIASTDTKPEEVVPPRGLIELPLPRWVWAAIILVSLGLLALGVFLAIRWSRRSRPAKADVLAPTPALPEHEEALRALGELEKSGFVARGEFKKLYFGSSEILKRYLGRRYEVDALESTSGEILSALESARLASDKDLDRLETLLNRMDVVKFTDRRPPHDEAAQLIDELRTWVRATRRADEIR